MQDVDVLIIGSGPSGSSTALHLCRIDSRWAERILVLEKAVHPRPKVCSGALSHHGAWVLKRLGMNPQIPHLALNQLRIIHDNRYYTFRGDPVVRVFQRSLFDHWLVQETRRQGVRIHENESAREIIIDSKNRNDNGNQTRSSAGVIVQTDRQTYRAQMLVIADGSRSNTRKLLQWSFQSRDMARMLDVTTAMNPTGHSMLQEKRADLFFNRMAAGIQGYYWDIPSLRDGQYYVNRGLFDSRIITARNRLPLKPELDRYLRAPERNVQLSDAELKSHPYHCFNPDNSFSRPRILLVGDAAGSDPLFGEGISFALGYGSVAANHIHRSFQKNDFSCRSYRDDLLADPVINELSLRTKLARLAYNFENHKFIHFCWGVASLGIHFTPWSRKGHRPAPDFD